MEILGNINDILIRKGDEGKIRIMIVDGSDVTVDRVELIIDKRGTITVQ